MKALTIYLPILFLLLTICSFGQNDNSKAMTSFIPKSNTYDIYYPKNFLLKEDAEGIVSINDSASGLNITISSYEVDENMTDEKLIEQLSGFIKQYYEQATTRANWNSYNTKFKILVELKFSNNKNNWVWWGVVNKNRLIIISINKVKPISAEDINLLQFMINNLIIK